MMAIQVRGACEQVQMSSICEKAHQAQKDETKEKANRVWKRYAASLCAAAAVFASLGVLKVILYPVSLTFSLLFLAGGLYALSKVVAVPNAAPRHLTDETLKAHREEARKLSLAETVKKHGWEKIFQQGLLTPDDFASKFHAMASGLALYEVIAYYEAATAAYDKVRKVSDNLKNIIGFETPHYQIPDPKRYREKWTREIENVKGWGIFVLFERYDLDKLEKYGILANPEQKKLTQIFKGLFPVYRQRLPVDPYKEQMQMFQKRHDDLVNKIKGCSTDADANALIAAELAKIPNTVAACQAKIKQDIRLEATLAVIYHTIGEYVVEGINLMAGHPQLNPKALNLTREQHIRIQDQIWTQQKRFVEEMNQELEKLKWKERVESAIQLLIDWKVPPYVQQFQDLEPKP